jgi:hypothetical protein
MQSLLSPPDSFHSAHGQTKRKEGLQTGNGTHHQNSRKRMKHYQIQIAAKTKSHQVCYLQRVSPQVECFSILSYLDVKSICVFIGIKMLIPQKRRIMMLLAITIKRRAMPALSIIPLTNWRSLAFWEYLFVQNRANLPPFIHHPICAMCYINHQTTNKCLRTGLVLCRSCVKIHFRSSRSLQLLFHEKHIGTLSTCIQFGTTLLYAACDAAWLKPRRDDLKVFFSNEDHYMRNVAKWSATTLIYGRATCVKIGSGFMAAREYSYFHSPPLVHQDSKKRYDDRSDIDDTVTLPNGRLLSQKHTIIEQLASCYLGQSLHSATTFTQCMDPLCNTQVFIDIYHNRGLHQLMYQHGWYITTISQYEHVDIRYC